MAGILTIQAVGIAATTGEYLGVAAVLLLLSPIMLMMALHKN